MNQNKVELCEQDSMMQKQSYKKPEVITFGSVAKYTLGGSGKQMDGCSGKIGKSNGNCD